MKYDYIVVGMGLAGCTLSHALIQRGKKVLLFDPDVPHTASKVAAGLFNPLTGPKMVRTWQVDALFTHLHAYYPRLEQMLGASFFHTNDMYRPFRGYDEQNDWLSRHDDPAYKTYVRKVYTGPHPEGDVHDPYGGLLLQKTGYVHTAQLLEAMKVFIGKNADMVPEVFADDRVQATARGITYGPYTSEGLIFCTGYEQMRPESFFGWLPVRPLKGEILTVKTENRLKTLYNRACFIIPHGDKRYRVGSTYNRHDVSVLPTESAREEISDKLHALLKRSFVVEGQEAGIRPTTPDRRPMLGRHPEWDRIAVFNGLGTKGVTLAPYFAERMAHHLIDGTELDTDVNIKRYYSLYFDSHAEK